MVPVNSVGLVKCKITSLCSRNLSQTYMIYVYALKSPTIFVLFENSLV